MSEMLADNVEEEEGGGGGGGGEEEEEEEEEEEKSYGNEVRTIRDKISCFERLYVVCLTRRTNVLSSFWWYCFCSFLTQNSCEACCAAAI